MINDKQKAIIKKDVNNVIFNKQIFPTLLGVPLVFSVIFPLILMVAIYFTQDDLGDFQGMLDMLTAQQHLDNLLLTVIGIIINFLMPTFFMMIPIIVASTTASSAFVGEKEKRTLETLLYIPLSVREIFRAKVLS